MVSLILEDWIIGYYLFCGNAAYHVVIATYDDVLIVTGFFLQHPFLCQL